MGSVPGETYNIAGFTRADRIGDSKEISDRLQDKSLTTLYVQEINLHSVESFFKIDLTEY